MPTLVTDGISPKTIAATAAGVALGVVVALLNALQTDPSLIGALPTWAQTVILIVVPPVLAGVSAYAAKPGQVVEDRATI